MGYTGCRWLPAYRRQQLTVSDGQTLGEGSVEIAEGKMIQTQVFFFKKRVDFDFPFYETQTHNNLLLAGLHNCRS